MKMCEYNYEEFLDYFIFPSKSRAVGEGIYVSNLIRKKFFLERQNKLTREGRVVTLSWENVGGGVWRAYLIKNND